MLIELRLRDRMLPKMDNFNLNALKISFKKAQHYLPSKKCPSNQSNRESPVKQYCQKICHGGRSPWHPSIRSFFQHFFSPRLPSVSLYLVIWQLPEEKCQSHRGQKVGSMKSRCVFVCVCSPFIMIIIIERGNEQVCRCVLSGVDCCVEWVRMTFEWMICFEAAFWRSRALQIISFRVNCALA